MIAPPATARAMFMMVRLSPMWSVVRLVAGRMGSAGAVTSALSTLSASWVVVVESATGVDAG
ncbi:hypothetical protein, partial [Escherichia coli]|uniref:hypothetical protein n=1 Tax=Escherichia coli TaxID=562 RepID=UPI001F4B47B3